MILTDFIKSTGYFTASTPQTLYFKVVGSYEYHNAAYVLSLGQLNCVDNETNSQIEVFPIWPKDAKPTTTKAIVPRPDLIQFFHFAATRHKDGFMLHLSTVTRLLVSLLPSGACKTEVLRS